MPRLKLEHLTDKRRGEPSVDIRGRVDLVRDLQKERYINDGVYINAHLESKEIEKYCVLDKESEELLKLAILELGISARAYDKILKVSRTIANTDGSQEIRVGDMVKVTVQVEPTARSTRYVVIDDPLPAGLVAVNPVFKTEEATPEEEDRFDYFSPEGLMRFRPNHLEMREDRVLAFRDWVYSGPQVFEYYARAVCEGTFVAPATKVSAMYAPLVYGCTAKGEITIKARP